MQAQHLSIYTEVLESLLYVIKKTWRLASHSLLQNKEAVLYMCTYVYMRKCI